MDIRTTKQGERHFLTYDEVVDYGSQGGGILSGGWLRFYCPIHGGDNQRSLSVNPENGWFVCHACGARGKIEDLGDDDATAGNPGALAGTSRWRPPPEPRPELAEAMDRFQDALQAPNWFASCARDYIKHRKIPLDVAVAYGAGFAPHGEWPGSAQWRYGRVVFPLTDPDGSVINLYGRTVSIARKDAGAGFRHRKLAGPQGLFNARALNAADRIWICEGVFDALTLAAIGIESAIALCGLKIPCWAWFQGVSEVVLALDADARAQEEAASLRRAFALRGKQVLTMPTEALSDCGDLNEARKRGQLDEDLLLSL